MAEQDMRLGWDSRVQIMQLVCGKLAEVLACDYRNIKGWLECVYDYYDLIYPFIKNKTMQETFTKKLEHIDLLVNGITYIKNGIEYRYSDQQKAYNKELAYKELRVFIRDLNDHLQRDMKFFIPHDNKVAPNRAITEM